MVFIWEWEMIDKRVLFAAGAGSGGVVSAILANILGVLDSPFSSWVATGALDAAVIGSFLVYVQNYYQSNSWKNFNKLLNGALKGLAIGATGGFLAYLCLSLFNGEIGRFVGWGISGAAAGYVASLRIPNLKIKVALTAGAIGGGLGFLIINIGLSYTMGVLVTGAVIGFMVAISEQVFREMSIDVILKPIETGISLAKPHCFNLTLGKDPITVGFSADMDINLKSQGIAIQKSVGNISLEDGKVFFTSINGDKKVEFTKGGSFGIENAEIVLQGKI